MTFTLNILSSLIFFPLFIFNQYFQISLVSNISWKFNISRDFLLNSPFRCTAELHFTSVFLFFMKIISLEPDNFLSDTLLQTSWAFCCDCSVISVIITFWLGRKFFYSEFAWTAWEGQKNYLLKYRNFKAILPITVLKGLWSCCHFFLKLIMHNPMQNR